MATMKKWKPGTPMGRKKGRRGPTMGPGAGKPPTAPPVSRPPSTAPKVPDAGTPYTPPPPTVSRTLGGATPVTGRSMLTKARAASKGKSIAGGLTGGKKAAPGSKMKGKGGFGYLPWNR